MSDMNGPTVRRVHHSGGDGRRLRMATVAALGSIALLLAACAGPTSSSSPSPSPSPSPRTDASAPKTSAKALDPAQAERLQRVWTPLLKAMDHPLQPNQVKVGLMDDAHINAANAGNGQFLVTTGLLEKANGPLPSQGGGGKSGLHGKTVPANGRRGRPQGKCHRKQTARARSARHPAGKGETVRQERTAPLATGAAG